MKNQQMSEMRVLNYLSEHFYEDRQCRLCLKINFLDICVFCAGGVGTILKYLHGRTIINYKLILNKV